MQPIGERLEEARKRKGVSLRDAAEGTKIRSDYLQKLEANKFDLGLTPLYVRGFLRTYANWLKLPGDKFVADYDAQGHDNPRASRPINREVYGRLEQSSASGSAAGGKADAEPRNEPSPTPTKSTTPSIPARPRSSPPFLMREGGLSSEHKALLQLVGMILGAVLIVGLAGWLLFGRGKAPAPVAKTQNSSGTTDSEVGANKPTTPSPVAVNPAVITALDTVHLHVWLENSDHTYGAELLPETVLQRGESRSLPFNGPLYIVASAAEKIRIEVGGKPILFGGSGVRGNQAFELQPPH